ncbi:MAG: hypothetical protein K8T26_06175 [Lentisphaerae bacterium]|nr:hypothetical protein [Lentisphaerota bacterium]
MSGPARRDIRPADQPRLGFLRTVRIMIDGIRYRLFRAAVTVAVIAVAVAFLMNIVSESIIKQRLAAAVRGELAKARLVHAWTARLTRLETPADLIARLARSLPAEPACAEARRMGGLDAAGLSAWCTALRQADAYLTFFESLDYDQRRALVHTAADTEIFDRLVDPAAWRTFSDRLATMRSVRFVTSPDAFADFLAGWPALSGSLAQVRAGTQWAIKTLESARGARPVLEALADPQADFAQAARRAGFDLDAATAAIVADQARATLDAASVEHGVDLMPARQTVAQAYDVMPADITVPMLWEYLQRPAAAESYLRAIRGTGADTGRLTPSGLAQLAQQRKRDAALERIERMTADATGGGWLGLGERMSWLLLVSMLVCAIGISNAMLMTVTERFREIATLKCLGALDEFILLVFVLESCCLGVAGGTIGAAAGAALGVSRMAVTFGRAALHAIPVGTLIGASLAAMLVGVGLAALAAVYPSLKAARLAPLEAMRIE